MPFPLLSTKLYIPPPRAGVVIRPRLTEKLLSGWEQPGRFVLLSGPAGFGKTTLLSELVTQLHQPVAWLSLDEADNDPIRFWTYLITACQSVAKGVGDTAMEYLRAPQPLPEDTIPTVLINDLTGCDVPVKLVLDDYHAIQNPLLHAGLAFLLDHLPYNLHLVISTRIDPPWPLARYRARNQLIEIRMQELRFTLQEAAEFLNRIMGLDLSAENLSALEERTEGWAAGLQLAALSMRGRSDLDAFIQAFTGSHVYIAEYLVDEVLKRQPEEMQDFLLKTSILDHLSAGLCNSVTGRPDGQDKLIALQQANIFTTPLDDEGHWFRYHHLFADLLKARLKSSFSETEIAGLHQHAAAWHERNGMTAEAIEHALAASDYASAVRLLETAALPMIIQAYVQTVEHWLQAIPQKWIEKSPRLNMACAWLNLLRGTSPRAVPYIQRLQAFFSAPGNDQDIDPSLRGEWLAIQSEYLIAQGKPQESREVANQAKDLLPQVDPYIRSMIYISLAKAYQLTFDYDQAAEIFQMIVRDARLLGDTGFEILGISGEAQMTLKQGRLHRTMELVNEGIRRIETFEKSTPFSATLYGELGEIYFYRGQFDLARTNLKRSVEISGKSGYSDPEIYFYLMLSKIAQMEGNLEVAAAEMQKASELAGIIPPAMIRENVISQQVRADLSVGRLAAAEKLLEPEGFSFGGEFHYPALAPGSIVSYGAGLLYNSFLRILLYQARMGSKPPELIRGIELGEQVFLGELQCQHLPIALETLLLLSQMDAAAGEERQSLIRAARALELAQPEGFISPFLEEGMPVAGILAKLAQEDLSSKVGPGYIQKILAAFPALPLAEEAAGVPRRVDPVQPLVEPLSPRELEVLRLIAAGDSNQAIADRLTITVSAVKKHTGNIYGKLGVNSRTQAISRARQSGLLSPDD